VIEQHFIFKKKKIDTQNDTTLLNCLKDRKSRFFLTALPALSLPNDSFPFKFY